MRRHEREEIDERCRIVGLLVSVVILASTVAPAWGGAHQAVDVARAGTFVTLTDVNARDVNGNPTNNNTIERFVASADGTAVVYAMTQNPVVGPCTSSRQIRRVDVTTGDDVLIGGCTEDLRYQYTSFDVSDDGARIVYLRENTAEEPEIVRCDFAGGSCTTSVVLQMLPNSDVSSLWISPHSADNEDGSLVLSGDGNWIFFRNNFTLGSPGRYSGPITVYRVSAASGAASVLFTFTELATHSPPLRASTSFIPSALAVDFTGSTLVFDSRASVPTVGWHDVAVIDTATGLGSVVSLAQNTGDSCCLAASPDISADGRTVTYVQRPGGSPLATAGVQVQQIDGSLQPVGAPVVIDVSTATKEPQYPCLSADGEMVGLFDDRTDRHEFRWALADGSVLRNATRPAVEVDRRGNSCSLIEGGGLVVHGSIRTAPFTFDLPWELLLFRWQGDPSAPRVTSIGAEPTSWFARDSNHLHPSMFTTFAWTAALDAPGEVLGNGYSAFLSGGAERSDQLDGEEPLYGVTDNGGGGYSDDYYWVEDGYGEDTAILRVGIVATNGTAVIADADVHIVPEAVESDQGSSFGTTEKAVGTVTFVFDDSECCEITVQRFNFAAPESVGTTGEFWRVFSGAPQGFYGGNGLTTAPYAAMMTFDVSTVVDYGQSVLYRTLDGQNWVEIPTLADAGSGTLSTTVPMSDVDGLWAVGEGEPVLPVLVFSSAFESGDLSDWAP